MKVDDWAGLSDEALVEAFRQVSAKHGHLLDARKTRAANKEFERVSAIETELKSRGAEARERMLRLLDDPEPGTRFWAASVALEYAPLEGTRVLAELAMIPLSMVGLSAAMTLETWRREHYRPG
ncbi:DUF2019 domain-containing protein [Corallococcus sp. BB11-1]|uniref:DUF2019 domain-containing protein n=1 Tax=Corallococcus sp. BB11-1 TaxID=2996783 RepID=UPI00226F64E1|nr:DUF2019 domain-containing protein [Corallococcus sp. BB11-1]MCY1036088.1 DUF2019 domain-containing protein [Corallococcus sp. BB11-1]